MASLTAASAIAAGHDFVVVALSRHQLESARREESRGGVDRLLASAGAEVRDDTAAVAVLSRPLVPFFAASFGALAAELALAPATVAILVPWKEPPVFDTRPDGVVDSFLCDAATFRVLRACAGQGPLAGSCFSLLDGILNGRIAIDRLVVRQLPCPRRPSPKPLDTRTALIMAHRGDPRHLSTALQSIAHADDAAQVRVRVGLDVETLDQYADVGNQFPQVTFCQVDPAPAGLFVIRQHFLERSPEEFFYLQDSDDASCSDRFAAQLDELRRTGADVVGCHELRVDEITGTVEALRLPLDVQEALSHGYSESLLNGTAAGNRRAVLRIGGYSTDQRIANDTQFMLRAYFLLRMRNIDGFFYVRRRHRASLTMAPDTGFGTRLRVQLRDTWASDFEAVLRGTLSLEHSSLRPMRSPIAYRFNDWVQPQAAPAVKTLQPVPMETVQARRLRR